MRKTFGRSKAEHDRNQRLGRRAFCGRSWAGRFSPSALNPNISRLPRGYDKSDRYSPFRTHLRRLARRGLKVSVTLEDLAEQWAVQEGRCFLTGWEMTNLAETVAVARDPRRASLDRIDPTQGYVVGNVRWVCMIANFAKHSWNDELVIAFAQAIVNNLSPSVSENL